MKRIALLLIVEVLFIGVFLEFGVAHAQVATESSYPEETPSKQKTRYDLPYPGMLPDNPLYMIKAARDRLIGLLINDPLKKAEFDLLNSDKRISAGLFLIEKNKDELAMETISKGHNYFHEAISMIDRVRKEGKNVGLLEDRMKLSLKKHRETLLEALPKMDKKYQQSLTNELKRLDALEQFFLTVIKKRN